ncbi:MarR family transcriptional regulator [Phenylobacterium sp.]|uniref:MarR family transcriptional regulator n=1 Tax=Phenylobacterium sp. TaxID=1871053 RepID=UPI0011FFC33A|nr:MarR family transcriptional regulator [Phenylobacterium sp.]TAL35828.1 MAG: MarR family transcriptional regulator [Phenylobacterium sp.]
MLSASEMTQAWERHSAALFSFTAFAARRMKLGLAEVAAMEQLVVHGPMTPGALGRALSMPSASITALVDRLEYKRMVVRNRNPADRRGYLLEITDNARERASLDLVPVLEAMTAFAETMTPEARQAACDYLAGVVDVMKTQQARA